MNMKTKSMRKNIMYSNGFPLSFSFLIAKHGNCCNIVLFTLVECLLTFYTN